MSDAEIEDILKKGDIDQDGLLLPKLYWWFPKNIDKLSYFQDDQLFWVYKNAPGLNKIF